MAALLPWGFRKTLATPPCPPPNLQAAALPLTDSSVIQTYIPSCPSANPRYDVIQYTVETGDSIFSNADKFNLHRSLFYGVTGIRWGMILT